jgi:hypothetical protein
MPGGGRMRSNVPSRDAGARSPSKVCDSHLHYERVAISVGFFVPIISLFDDATGRTTRPVRPNMGSFDVSSTVELAFVS